MKGPSTARKVVILPDAHSSPEYDNDRFGWLGRFIRDEQPDVVVCLGDVADMRSLSSYDKGKRSFEGRRYSADCESARDANMRLRGEAGEIPGCQWYLCWGNHEHRIQRAANDAAEFEGTIDFRDLGFSDEWTCLPYQAVLDVGGFLFSHHFASGVGGRAISGMNQAAAMVRLLHRSAVAGHSHVYDVSIQTRPDSSRVMALVAGCYVHLEHDEGWSTATQPLWVNGITVLEGVADGWAQGWRFVSQLQLRDRYAAAVRTELPPAPPVPRAPAPAIDVGGLDFDDDRTSADAGAALSNCEAARRTGRTEKAVREWRRRYGGSAADYVAWVSVKEDA